MTTYASVVAKANELKKPSQEFNKLKISDEVKKSPVLEFIKASCKPPSNKNIMVWLEDYATKHEIKDWRDFAIALSKMEEGEEGNTVNMFLKSSTWAVCQLFLGNLDGIEKRYAQERGGTWYLELLDKPNEQHEWTEIFSVRSLLCLLRQKFPTQEYLARKTQRTKARVNKTIKFNRSKYYNKTR